MIRAAFALVLMAAPATAQDAGRVEAIEVAWLDWLSGVRAGESALAITYEGDVIQSVGRGMEPTEPAPLASLSKAITAACLLDLADDGLVDLNAPIGTYLETKTESRLGQFMTHSSGLQPDRTQQAMWDWVNDPVGRHPDAAGRALGDAFTTAPGTYFYNNENYAVLGLVIEEVTGADYFDTCKERVLDPLDLTSAGRSARYGAFLPWGGWEMSAADYAAFVGAVLGPGAPYNDAVDALPLSQVGQGIQYGAGSLYFAAEGQKFFWHFGLLCFGAIDGAGAYFAQFGAGYGVAVTFEGCPGEAALGDLDQALAAAVLR